MAWPFENANHRFGSARFATEAEMEAAGLFEYSDKAIYGGKAFGRRIWLKFTGGAVMVAGARTGKLRDILAQNICHAVLSDETLVIVDVKGELAAISQDQTPDKKSCIYWNPQAMFGLPQHRINPVGHLRWSSPFLISDTKLYMAGLLPESGAGAAKYFELNARRVGEGIAVSLAEAIGVVDLPELYRAIIALQAGGPLWAPYASEMRSSSVYEVRALATEIEAAQSDGSGGWRGIVGELMQAFGCLSDPALRASVSPPFDYNLQDLTTSDRKAQLYLMCPERMVELWAPVMKSYMNAILTLKGRAPSAPSQTWIIDEAARFKGYSEIADLFTIGAGLGIRPFAIFQDLSQMDDLGQNAQRKILSSAAAQIYFGVRDQQSAKHVSDLLGEETLPYDDPIQQGRATVDLLRALGSLFTGEGLRSVLPRLRQKAVETEFQPESRRKQRTPDEVIQTPDDRGYLFVDGLHPIYMQRQAYWTQEWMVGRYHPNPYHPPSDKVRVQTRKGPRFRPVLARKVPEAFADYPQYQDGIYSYIGERYVK